MAKALDITHASDSIYAQSKYLAGLSDEESQTEAIDSRTDNHRPVNNLPILVEGQSIENRHLDNRSADNRPVASRPAENRPVENPLGETNEFSSRRRTLDIAILNNTKDTLRFEEDYFYCGSWFVSPKPVNIPPGEICIGYVSSRSPSLFGVNGGIMYELLGKSKFLYIGFDNPALGRYKTFIELTGQRRSAEWACKQTKTDSVKNHYDGNYHIMAVIKPPKQSKYRLFRYTIEEISHSI